MEVAKRLISRYFNENYKSLCLIHLDDSKIVLNDDYSNKKFVLPFVDQFPFSEIIKEMYEYPDDEQKYTYIKEVLPDLISWDEIKSKNEKLTIFKDTGYKFGSVVELIFNYSVVSSELETREDKHETDNFDMYEFRIDDISIQIGQPSDLFKLIFHENEEDDYHVGWQVYTTILLKGVTADNFKSVIQQAFFLIHETCPSAYAYDYPSIGELCWEYGESEKEYGEDGPHRSLFQDEVQSKTFSCPQFLEPIAFYNAGKSSNDVDASFLYYYKVFEYFFFFSQSNEIRALIEQYDLDSNINSFIKNVQTNYFGQQEDKLLLVLFESIPAGILQLVIDKAHSSSYITSKDLESFCEALYKHRNSIVHGKYEYRIRDIKLPDIFGSTESKFWMQCADYLAHYLIMHSCYNKE